MCGLEHLSKNIELKLTIGIIAYAYRSGISVSSEMSKYLLLKRVLIINIIEDLGLGSTLETDSR